MDYALIILTEVGRIVSEALACTDQKRKEEFLRGLVDRINLAVKTYGEKYGVEHEVEEDEDNEDSEVKVADPTEPCLNKTRQ